MTIHLGSKRRDIAEVVLLPGDPLRAKWAAENFLTNIKKVNEVRGMLGYTGTWNGNQVTIQGSGMGMPSLSIYVNELIKDFGVKTLIRIGSAGGMQEKVALREVVLAMTASSVSTPSKTIFKELIDGSGDRKISTTMAYVRLITLLTKDKNIGKNIVPIIPDEARTFGMDPLFRQLGIYSSSGQLYDPVDSDQFLYYKEATDGQILEEGINEAGAVSSFIAAGTSYSNHGIKMIPFYIYYSMFGFQRTWDLIWAAGDMRARGFLLGGTAGRTTLNGEGLQHQDGHSHLAAAATPNIKAYDLAYGYEIATIIHHGLVEMCEKNKDVIYYLTLENENYEHPPMPDKIQEDIISGLYKIKSTSTPTVRLLGSGPLMREVLEAEKLLKKDWGIEAGVWNVTSFSELRRDAEETERWNLLHSDKKPKKSHLEKCLSINNVPTVAVSDYVKMVSEQIGPYVPGNFYALGTDGFGRSDTRKNLRKFFEVDRYYVVLTALKALALDGKIETTKIKSAMKKYDLDPEKPSPITV